MRNTLYYGDNLPIMRQYVAGESVDLVYLDPPFNSNRSYNVLFQDESGQDSNAQITAFEDTWHWPGAVATYHELVTEAAPSVSRAVSALHDLLGENQMTAYLVMMAARLVELHRVLKPTGSIYLHCDPTASHYLKVLMDAIFGPRNYRNEVIWERTNAHNFKTNGWVRSHDTLLYYSKTDDFLFNIQYTRSYSEAQLKRYKPDADGRLYTGRDLTFTGTNPARRFEWRGVHPPANRVWGASLEQLEQWYAEGRILLKRDGTPRLDGLKTYLDETKGGSPIGTTWTDIPRIANTSDERLGYPTQKPLALLARCLEASSNPGGLVLDPFCGCGTAVIAAEQLGRQWIGIDVTHLAITLQKHRLLDTFGLEERRDYDVVGEPQDLESAHQLAHDDRYQFQWWALSLVHARPVGGDGKKGKKGSDQGIDGIITFTEAGNRTQRVLVQVKSGHVNSGMVRDLHGVLEREQAAVGLFVTLDPPTGPMLSEAASAGFYTSLGWGKSYPRLQILTIEELMDGRGPQIPAPWGTFKQARPTPEPQAMQGRLLE